MPHGAQLTADPRSALVNGDFFAPVDSPPLDSTAPGRRFDAILVDIDRSPAKVPNRTHAAFWRRASLRCVSEHQRPADVFGRWSDDRPHAAFQAELDAVFARSLTHVVRLRTAAARVPASGVSPQDAGQAAEGGARRA